MDSKRKTISTFLSSILEEDSPLFSNFKKEKEETAFDSKNKRNMSFAITLSMLFGYAFAFIRVKGSINEDRFNLVFSSFSIVSLLCLMLTLTTAPKRAKNCLIALSVYSIGLCMFFFGKSITGQTESNYYEIANESVSILAEMDFNKEKAAIIADFAAKSYRIQAKLGSFVNSINIFTQCSYSSIIYCNGAFLMLDGISWLSTGIFVSFASVQTYFLVADVESHAYTFSYLMQFISVFIVVLAFKYNLHTVIRDLNLRNDRLSKIKHFYHEWLLNLNVSYCLVKQGQIVFFNNDYDKHIGIRGLKEEMKVHTSFSASVAKGMSMSEIFEVAEKIENLPFTKIAVLGTEECEFECSIRKYSSGFLEVFFSDISYALKQEREKVEQKYRNTVFAKIAHEFKTPVTNIVLIAQKLREKVSDSAILAELNVVQGLCDHVTFLVSDITSYFHGHSRLKMVPELVKLTEVCEFCFNVLSSMLEVKSSSKKNVIPKLICCSNLTLMIDQVRLKQILLNLISNAAKFTVHGCITLKCEETGEGVILSVNDEGMGMSEQKLEQLRAKEEIKFEVRDEYNKMGSGLGMSISKQICDEMGIKFKIESEQGKGTTVSIVIPKGEFLAESEENTTVDTIPFTAPYLMPQDSSSPASAVIIAEDNSIIRKSLKTVIERMADSLNKEWRVIDVEDGVFALSEVINLNLEGTEVEFLITDEFMDFLNGSDSIVTLKKLMEEQKIKSFPCFSCSAFEDESFREKILSSGADSLLPKPATRERLTEILKDYSIL